MSDSLSKSFSKITVVSPPPPMQLTIPQRETNGRRMFFGIETTRQWLLDYTLTYRLNRGWPVSTSTILNLYEAEILLRRHSGAASLGIKTVLPENATIPPARRSTYQTLPLPKSGGPIIAVCSSESRSFRKRPTEEQMNALKQIMGKEPKWWVDDEDRSYK